MDYIFFVDKFKKGLHNILSKEFNIRWWSILLNLLYLGNYYENYYKNS